MEHESSTISVRTNKKLKAQVGKILEQLGLNHSVVINMFYHKIKEHNGIPFDVRLPNKETIQAMKDLDQGKNISSNKNSEELFEDLGI